MFGGASPGRCAPDGVAQSDLEMVINNHKTLIECRIANKFRGIVNGVF